MALFEREQPEMSLIVSAWPTLSEPIKAAVLALVQTPETGE